MAREVTVEVEELPRVSVPSPLAVLDEQVAAREYDALSVEAMAEQGVHLQVLPCEGGAVAEALTANAMANQAIMAAQAAQRASAEAAAEAEAAALAEAERLVEEARAAITGHFADEASHRVGRPWQYEKQPEKQPAAWARGDVASEVEKVASAPAASAATVLAGMAAVVSVAEATAAHQHEMGRRRQAAVDRVWKDAPILHAASATLVVPMVVAASPSLIASASPTYVQSPAPGLGPLHQTALTAVRARAEEYTIPSPPLQCPRQPERPPQRRTPPQLMMPMWVATPGGC